MPRVFLAVATVITITAAIIALGGHVGAEPRVIDLAVKGGKLPDDHRVTRVQQGDDITLRWTPAEVLTIHLHGYEIETKLAPGRTMTKRFTARATGRFPIESHRAPHGREETLGYLEVHPR